MPLVWVWYCQPTKQKHIWKSKQPISACYTMYLHFGRGNFDTVWHSQVTLMLYGNNELLNGHIPTSIKRSVYHAYRIGFVDSFLVTAYRLRPHVSWFLLVFLHLVLRWVWENWRRWIISAKLCGKTLTRKCCGKFISFTAECQCNLFLYTINTLPFMLWLSVFGWINKHFLVTMSNYSTKNGKNLASL